MPCTHTQEHTGGYALAHKLHHHTLQWAAAEPLPRVSLHICSTGTSTSASRCKYQLYEGGQVLHLGCLYDVGMSSSTGHVTTHVPLPTLHLCLKQNCAATQSLLVPTTTYTARAGQHHGTCMCSRTLIQKNRMHTA